SAALALHARQHGGHAMQHAADVDVDHAVPFVDLQRGHGRQRHDPGVVDDDVDAAVELQREIGEGLHVGALCDVDGAVFDLAARRAVDVTQRADVQDRKSTRLNSSHVKISYAVFRPKKKTIFAISAFDPVE